MLKVPATVLESLVEDLVLLSHENVILVPLSLTQPLGEPPASRNVNTIEDVSDNFDYTAERKAETQAVIDAEAQRATDKANAKAKLMAGEALTEAEADTIVL